MRTTLLVIALGAVTIAATPTPTPRPRAKFYDFEPYRTNRSQEQEAAERRAGEEALMNYWRNLGGNERADAEEAPPKIMIFGGRSHRTYLGCLSCATTDTDSIFNTSGPFGSCSRYDDDNLHCRTYYSTFAAPLASRYSACDPYAQDPPVIVDDAGRYYGRLSIAEHAGHRDSPCNPLGDARYRDKDVCAFARRLCAN